MRARSEQRDILELGREDGQIDFEGSEVALGGGGERTGVVDALDREDLVHRSADGEKAHSNDRACRQDDGLADLHDADDGCAHD